MPGVSDVQFTPLTVANDDTEQQVYAFNVTGGSITTASRYQVVLSGVLSTRLLAPGTFTMRLRLGDSAVATIVDESMVLGAANARYTANLEAWLRPDNAVGLGGFFAQHANDIFTTSGVRLSSAAASVDLSVDQLLSVSVQFSAADPDNSFTRALAALFILTG